MSEKLIDDGTEVEPEAPELQSQQPEQPLEVERSTPEQEASRVEEIRETIDRTAEATPLPDIESNTPNDTVSLPPADKALKAQTLNQTLKTTRQQLSKPQKVLSKIIHQSQVDTVSNATGKTIARPIGLFFGGLFALIGSALYLFLSYHYHFAYKYIAFTLFFVGGFIIGLLIEFIGKIFTRKKV
jgi:preprotein translocase subunit SecF